MIIDEYLFIDKSLVIPHNITLYFLNKIKIANDITVQIDGFIIDKPIQMFEFELNPDSSNGCILLGLNQQDFIRPEWFGAIGDDINDDSFAFQKTFNVAKSTKITKIKFMFKNYYIANTINITYFDLILEGSLHDKFETTDSNFGSIHFSDDLTSGFYIDPDRGFGAHISNLFFRSNNNNLTIFDFTLNSLPARNLTIEHCRFRGKCDKLFSFVMKEEDRTNGTGVCTVTFRYNNFVGSGYCIYADGKYALMNTTIENNTIEWGMKFKSVNNGVGTSFVVRSNLFEGTSDLFDISCLRTNIEISNNYFEAIDGLFLFNDSVSALAIFNYNSNYDMVGCDYTIQTNATFHSDQVYLPSRSICLGNSNIELYRPYIASIINYSNKAIMFANSNSVANDILNEAISNIIIPETEYVAQTKYGEKYFKKVTGYGTVYNVDHEFVTGDQFVIITPSIYRNNGTTGYVIYDGDTKERDSYLSRKSFLPGEGFLVSFITMNFDGSKFKFRFYEPADDTFYHSDIKVYKVNDGKYKLIY